MVNTKPRVVFAHHISIAFTVDGTPDAGNARVLYLAHMRAFTVSTDSIARNTRHLAGGEVGQELVATATTIAYTVSARPTALSVVEARYARMGAHATSVKTVVPDFASTIASDIPVVCAAQAAPFTGGIRAPREVGAW